MVDLFLEGLDFLTWCTMIVMVEQSEVFEVATLVAKHGSCYPG